MALVWWKWYYHYPSFQVEEGILYLSAMIFADGAVFFENKVKEALRVGPEWQIEVSKL
jgi:hypothetical protein